MHDDLLQQQFHGDPSPSTIWLSIVVQSMQFQQTLQRHDQSVPPRLMCDVSMRPQRCYTWNMKGKTVFFNLIIFCGIFFWSISRFHGFTVSFAVRLMEIQWIRHNTHFPPSIKSTKQILTFSNQMHTLHINIDISQLWFLSYLATKMPDELDLIDNNK